MNDESRAEDPEALALARQTVERQQQEIERLERRLADERFAQELKDAMTLAASTGAIASPVSHSRLLERRRGLQERARAFAEGLEEDAAFSQALELARLVQEISRQGENELRGCQTILRYRIEKPPRGNLDTEPSSGRNAS